MARTRWTIGMLLAIRKPWTGYGSGWWRPVCSQVDLTGQGWPSMQCFWLARPAYDLGPQVCKTQAWTRPVIPVHFPTLQAWIMPINTLWKHGRDQNSRPALACASRSVDDRGWLGPILR